MKIRTMQKRSLQTPRKPKLAHMGVNRLIQHPLLHVAIRLVLHLVLHLNLRLLHFKLPSLNMLRLRLSLDMLRLRRSLNILRFRLIDNLELLQSSLECVVAYLPHNLLENKSYNMSEETLSILFRTYP